MPWHDVQYLKITRRAGPFGGVTCGRVGRPAICADTADEPSTAPSATTIAAAADMPVGRTVTASHHLQRMQPAGARPDPVLLDPVQVQHAQQHVRGALRVVGEHEVTVPLERAVDASDENHGHLLVRMAMRVAHVAALVDQHVIEHRAVAIRMRRSSSRMLSVYVSIRALSPAPRSCLNAASSPTTASRMLAFRFRSRRRSSALVPSPNRRSNTTRGFTSGGSGCDGVDQEMQLVYAQL